MTNISQVAKETQIRYMKEAHHPKNAILYIKQSMYIHQRKKHGMIHMVQKKIPQESTRKGNKPQVPPVSAQM
jgi:hypothetical protein